MQREMSSNRALVADRNVQQSMANMTWSILSISQVRLTQPILPNNIVKAKISQPNLLKDSEGFLQSLEFVANTNPTCLTLAGWHNLRGFLATWFDPKSFPHSAYVKNFATFATYFNVFDKKWFFCILQSIWFSMTLRTDIFLYTETLSYEEMILDQIRLRGSPASCASLHWWYIYVYWW